MWYLTITALVFALFQTDVLPPAYPRPGTTKLLDNARVQVWNIAWLKQQYPLHRHVHALVGVYYAPGDRTIISTAGERRPVSTPAWDTVFQRAGVTHVEEGASDEPLRAVFIEMKDEGPLGAPASSPPSSPPPFPAGAGTQTLDNERTTAWEFVPPPALRTNHRHAHDAVVVAFTGRTPKVSFVARGTVHADEGVTGADRLYVFEIK
jgi:hypothetical protein